MNQTEIKKQILADGKVSRLLAEAKEALATYRQHMIDNDHLLDPLEASRRISTLIGQAKTSAELEAALSMRAEVEVSSEDVRTIARCHARDVYSKALDKLKPLTIRVKELLDSFTAEAIEAEKKFFTENGLPVEATSVRITPQTMAQDFTHFFNTLKLTNLLPSPNHGVLDWLK